MARSRKSWEVRHKAPSLDLNEEEQTTFDWWCDYLVKHSMFKDSDKYLIERLAKDLRLHREASDRINSIDDCVQTFKNGTQNMSVWFTAQQRYAAAIDNHFKELSVSVKWREQNKLWTTEEKPDNGYPLRRVVGE